MSIASRIEAMNTHVTDAYDAIGLSGVTIDYNKNIDNLDVGIKKSYLDIMNNGIDVVWENWEKVTGTGTTLTLNQTAYAPMKFDYAGNISQTVIEGEEGTEVSNTSINVSNLNTTKESYITLKGNTTQKSYLPSEYTQVDYIESSGTQCIDTGFVPDCYTKYDITLSINELFSGSNFFISAQDNSQRNNIYSTSTGGYSAGYGSVYRNSNYTLSLNTKYNLVLDKNELYADGTLIETITSQEFGNTVNAYLFCQFTGETANFSAIKLYQCKIYDNGTLVRFFIPCFRNSDNEIGLYDLVNDTFYTNEGTGTFTKGSNTSIPNPSYPVSVDVVTGDNTVEVCGKNLLPPYATSVINKDVEISSDGYEYTINGTSNGSGSLENPTHFTLGAGTYKLNSRYVSGSVDSMLQIIITNANNKQIGSISYDSTNYTNDLSCTITLAEDTECKYVFYMGGAGRTYDIFKVNIQLTKGSSTDYNFEEYTGASYPVNIGSTELCKIGDYQDKFYKSNGKWYLHKEIGKVVLNGSESYTSMGWTSSKFAARTTINNLKIIKSANDDSLLLSNCFVSYSPNVLFGLAVPNYGIARRVDQSDIIIRNDDYTNTTDLKTWLSTNNTTVYYVLATPTDTEITDTTLKGQLEALYNATTYGTTNVKTTITDTIGYTHPYINLLYNNITPSPSPDRPSDVHLVSGDNSVVVENINLCSSYRNTTNTAKYSNSLFVKAKLKPSTYYEISFIDKSNGNNYYRNEYLMDAFSAYNIISDGQRQYWSFLTKSDINTNADVEYLIFKNYQAQSSAPQFTEVDIREVSQITTDSFDYVPYQNASYPINLGVENILPYNIQTIKTNNTSGTWNNNKYTYNGITFACNDDGTIQATGTSTSASYMTLYANLSLNGTFTISSGLGISADYYARVLDRNNSYAIVMNTDTNSPTATLNTNTNVLIYVKSGLSNVNVLFKPMIEKGSKANTYTPYGTTPIELCKIGTYQDKIAKSTGKNLFDKDNATYVRYLAFNNDYIKFQTIASDVRMYYMPCEKNTTYTISKSIGTLLRCGSCPNIPTNEGTITNTVSGGSSNVVTVTTTSNDNYIYMYFLSTSEISSISYDQVLPTVMINEGETAIPYEPYGTDWYLKKEINKIVADGTNVKFTYKGSIENLLMIPASDRPRGLASTTSLICNRFSDISTGTGGALNRLYWGASTQMWLCKDGFTDITTGNTWLQSNNVIVYYVLATPTYTKIEGTLASQLEAIKRSYENQTNITQTNNDLPFVLSVSALKELS